LSHLNKKSADNLAASSLLIDNKLYASSVHCSYYGMFQHMTCQLIKFWQISFEELSKKSIASKKNSHEFLINESLQIIEIKRNGFVKRDVKKAINDLKTYRVQSDYHNIEILENKSKDALALSLVIIEKLNEIIK
jgi:uncharacterized protein (UPF0332 family)